MANYPKPSGASTIWASSGTRSDPGDAKTSIGWVVETPPYQQANWLDWKQDSFIAHFNQHGIPSWDAVTEYQGNLSYTQGSDGIIYKCLATNTNIDPVNPLNSTYWKQAWEDFGSVAVVSAALAAHIANYQTLAGLSNVGTARANLSVYSKAEQDSRYAALLGNSGNNFSVAAATQPAHAIPLSQLNSLLTQATETTPGILALATNAKAAAGTDDLTAITPLKGATVYLMKSGNLSGLANVATARANLGLGSMAIESATSFLRASNNLSDVPDKAVARANLGLTSTAGQPETYFLRVAQNLADVVDKTAARTNLGLTTTATTALASLMLKADNLTGLTNVAAARSNLGLADTATIGSSNFLFRGSNLGDLSNVQAARNNLGLGGAAVKNIINVPGDLDFTSLQGDIGYAKRPDGLIEQWGIASLGGGSNELLVGFPLQFPNGCFNVQLTNYEDFPNEANTVRVRSKTRDGFILSNGVGNTFTSYMWRAIGN